MGGESSAESEWSNKAPSSSEDGVKFSVVDVMCMEDVEREMVFRDFSFSSHVSFDQNNHPSRSRAVHAEICAYGSVTYMLTMLAGRWESAYIPLHTANKSNQMGALLR